jgi:hypothetical protein
MNIKSNRLLIVLVVFLAISSILFSAGKATAQNKKADTISSNDVQFTSIPTAQDSIALRKKAMQKQAQSAALQAQSAIGQAQQMTQTAATVAKRQAAPISRNRSGIFFGPALPGGLPQF